MGMGCKLRDNLAIAIHIKENVIVVPRQSEGEPEDNYTP
jgi:hypothetical protein